MRPLQRRAPSRHEAAVHAPLPSLLCPLCWGCCSCLALSAWTPLSAVPSQNALFDRLLWRGCAGWRGALTAQPPSAPHLPCQLHQPPGTLISAHLPQTDGGPLSGRGRVSCAVHLPRALQTEVCWMLVPEWSALPVAAVTGGARATLPDSSRSAQHSTMTRDFASPLATPGSVCSEDRKSTRLNSSH